MSLSPAARFMQLFTGNPAAHGTHSTPTFNPAKSKWEIRTSARTFKEKVTIELWERHLAGEYPLGIIPIQPDGNVCQWGCIDIDEYQDDLLSIIQTIEHQHQPLVPCRSKSGGMHLFLFLTEPRPAIEVINLLRDIAAHIGHATAEIFPKQTTVNAERGDVGNWIVMPYFGSTYEGKLREQVGLKKTGAEMEPIEFLDVAETARLTPDHFIELTQKPRTQINGTPIIPGKPRPPKGPFADGPPCLEIMAKAGWANSRNETLMHCGIYCKRAFSNDWKTKLQGYNYEFGKPPLESGELVGIIQRLEKKDYEYFCKHAPMVDHCNSTLCRSRRFGVGAEGDYPRISSIAKLNSDPPIWIMEVSDMSLELTTEELQNYQFFQRAALAKGTKFFKMMKHEEWRQAVQVALDNLVPTEDATPDLSRFEVLREHIEDFVTNRQKGRQRDDLLTGRPWEDEEAGRHYFKLSSLIKHLHRTGEKDLRRNHISQRLRDLGGGPHFFNLKGKGINVWWIPSSCVSATPTPDPPPLPSTPI